MCPSNAVIRIVAARVWTWKGRRLKPSAIQPFNWSWNQKPFKLKGQNLRASESVEGIPGRRWIKRRVPSGATHRNVAPTSLKRRGTNTSRAVWWHTRSRSTQGLPEGKYVLSIGGERYISRDEASYIERERERESWGSENWNLISNAPFFKLNLNLHRNSVVCTGTLWHTP